METVPVIGRGRGARFKHLYLKKEENPITWKIRSTLGDAHFLAMKSVDWKRSEKKSQPDTAIENVTKLMANSQVSQSSQCGALSVSQEEQCENKISPLKIDVKVHTDI